MVNRIIFAVLVGIAPFLLSGCYTLGYVEIEVIRPAQIAFPSQINRLLVINNCLTKPTGAYTHDIQRGLFKLDTTATQLLTKQVTAMFNQSPRFEETTLVPNIHYRRVNDVMQPITWDNVNMLCMAYETDALVSLEAFGINDTLVRVSYYDGYGYTTYKSMALFVNSMWRVYNNLDKTVIERRVLRDTILIEELTSKREYFDAITTDEGIQFVAEKVAAELSIKIADRLAPFWEPVTRDFYIYNSKLMQQAANYAYADKWNDAALIWKTITDDTNVKMAAAACHNMALVCEVEGKLDLALVWLEKSLKLYNSVVSQDYKAQILFRINETELLNRQFGITN